MTVDRAAHAIAQFAQPLDDRPIDIKKYAARSRHAQQGQNCEKTRVLRNKAAEKVTLRTDILLDVNKYAFSRCHKLSRRLLGVQQSSTYGRSRTELRSAHIKYVGGPAAILRQNLVQRINLFKKNRRQLTARS
ncbi:MAG: hypothetical protein WCF55_20725, partial [Pseudolabrys sp.]